jgi:hypothetical protein
MDRIKKQIDDFRNKIISASYLTHLRKNYDCNWKNYSIVKYRMIQEERSIFCDMILLATVRRNFV